MEADMENNENKGNEKWRENGRLAIYVMAGFYLLTLVGNMMKAIPNSTGTSKIIMIVFSVLFAIIGVGMMAFGMYRTYRNAKKLHQSWKEMEENPEIEEKSDEE